MKADTSTPNPAGTLCDGVDPPLLVALREVQKGVAGARDAMTFVTDKDVLGDALCELVGLGVEIDSLRLELIDYCGSNAVASSIGVRTMGQYVAARTNHAAKATNKDTKLLEWLRAYPLFAAGLQTRAMTLAHLQYLRHKIDNVRTAAVLRGDQQFFVDLAGETGFKEFKQACDYWLVMIDPDGDEPQDQLDKSGLTITTGSGGRIKIVVEFDAVTGHGFMTMVEHETKKIRTQDIDNSVERTPGQQRLAALFGLAKRGYARKDGTLPVPLINIVMSQRIAQWALNHPNDPISDIVPVHPLDVDGRCELLNGQPVHPLLVTAITGLYNTDAVTLRRYVMTADSRIIDYSYNARIAPEHLRTASHIEHRGQCGTPGCDAPHSWLQIDHINPHSNNGPTSLKNSQPACAPDNQAKAATTGQQAFKNKPPPPKYRPRNSGHRPDDTDEDDPDGDDSDSDPQYPPAG